MYRCATPLEGAALRRRGRDWEGVFPPAVRWSVPAGYWAGLQLGVWL